MSEKEPISLADHFDDLSRVRVHPRLIDLLNFDDFTSTHHINNPTMIPVVKGTGEWRLSCDKPYFSLDACAETTIKVTRSIDFPLKSRRVSIGFLPAVPPITTAIPTWRESPHLLFTLGFVPFDINIRFRGNFPWGEEVADLCKSFTVPRDFGQFLHKHKIGTNGVDLETISIHDANLISVLSSLNCEETMLEYDTQMKTDGSFPFPKGSLFPFTDLDEFDEEKEKISLND
ncbi:unnamed protein product, partial [Mesorhabditis belari]|uniref:Uncharacterized protein n=1 Tax=Mesorhabditis belari TaxID=2138241 RepID=A0AAF3F642_9BILA